MSRNSYAATAANLDLLINDQGLTVPDGLRDTLADAFANTVPGSAPSDRLRALLRHSTGGVADNDVHSPAIRALAEELTATQVWQVLCDLDGTPGVFLSTAVWVCVRDGLLPHDQRILDLGSTSDSVELRLEAINQALLGSTVNSCSLLHRAHREGRMTAEDLAKTGHGDCVPLTRDEVYTATDGMGLPVHRRAALLFDQTSWAGRSIPGPEFSDDPDLTVSDQLLSDLHHDLSSQLRTSGDERWVEIVKWFTDLDNRRAGLTQGQTDRLLTQQPGLASDLLVWWLGPRGVDFTRVVREHALTFVNYTKVWATIDHGQWREWMNALIDTGHRAVALADLDQLMELVVDTGRLHEVPWLVRKRLVTGRGDVRSKWLRDKAHPPAPAEVAVLVREGAIDAYGARHLYASVPEPIRKVLLEVPGLAAEIAETMSKGKLLPSDREGICLILSDVQALMPDDEQTRTRLMARLLTATEDGTGPLDGDAVITHGFDVLTARWAAKAARVSKQKS